MRMNKLLPQQQLISEPKVQMVFFIFNFQTFDGSKRIQIVNVEMRDNGRANNGILERATEIQKIREELNIIIRTEKYYMLQEENQ